MNSLCLLFVFFFVGAVTKDAETQTEITMNDKLFQQSVSTTSQRENPDGKALRYGNVAANRH